MSAKFSNNATSRLSVSISSTDTSLSVQAGDGEKYPSPTGNDWFPLTLLKANGDLEITKCTARSGDVFTIDRGQENTSPKSFSVGDRVEVRMTEGAYEERMREKVDKAGDTMTGPLTLSGDAEDDLHAVPKQQLDEAISEAVGSGKNGFGNRTVSSADPSGGADGDIWYKV